MKLTDQADEGFMIKKALKDTAGIAVVSWVRLDMTLLGNGFL